MAPFAPTIAPASRTYATATTDVCTTPVVAVVEQQEVLSKGVI